jgi:glycosyltransferase involved in cell wall biosynthesis
MSKHSDKGAILEHCAALTVVIVCDHAKVVGGLSKVAITSACALRTRGHRVIYFAAVGPPAPFLLTHGVEVVTLNQEEMLTDPSRMRAARRGLWNGVASRALSQILVSLNPKCSIVHIHGWSKALSPSVLRSSRLSGVPVVQTLHDYVSICPNGAFFDFVQERNCALQPLSSACIACNCDARRYAHKLWRVSRHLLLERFGRPLDHTDVIVLNERQRAIIEQYVGPDVRLHYVPNPTDVLDLGPAPVRDNEAFVFLGRLSAEKGPVLFAKAAAAVGAPAVFLGDGPMRREIAGFPGASITGWLEREPALRRLRRARALVFPSLCFETFGLPVAEAIANGIPPIISDNTTAAQLIEPAQTGLLFRNGDIEDLACCIRLLQDAGMAARLGGEAYRRYWAAPLSVEQHVTRTEAVYRQILGRGHANATA